MSSGCSCQWHSFALKALLVAPEPAEGPAATPICREFTQGNPWWEAECQIHCLTLAQG